MIGSVTYLIGTLGVTIACDVPRNDSLAKIESTGPGADCAWATYNREWTA